MGFEKRRIKYHDLLIFCEINGLNTLKYLAIVTFDNLNHELGDR